MILGIMVCATMAALTPVASTELKVTMEGGKSFVIACDSKGSPKTVKRIVELVKKKFYDGQRFHRVESWVVQWGDPASKKSANEPGVGSGGSGQALPWEESTTSFVRGVVGVASTGAKVGGDSQLFVLTHDATHLNGNYAVLGKVTKGMDVVDKIARGDKIVSITVVGK